MGGSRSSGGGSALLLPTKDMGYVHRSTASSGDVAAREEAASEVAVRQKATTSLTWIDFPASGREGRLEVKVRF